MPFQGQQVNLSGPAAGALGRGILVTIDTAGRWAVTGAGLAANGVTLEAAAAIDDIINVAALNGAKLEMQAGAAIGTAGIDLAANATGQAITATTGQVVVGFSASAVGAAAEIVDVITAPAGAVAP